MTPAVRFALALLCAMGGMYPAEAQDADALKARYGIFRERLATNQFGQPRYLESSDEPGTLQGDIYATVEYPSAAAGPALQSVSHWCGILILHQNVKSCRASRPPSGDTLCLNIGRKYDRPLSDAYPFEFLYQATGRPDYLHATLNADKGPLGTSHCRIDLEVVALDAGNSFLHLSYSYTYGTAARVAMQGYLAMKRKETRRHWAPGPRSAHQAQNV